MVGPSITRGGVDVTVCLGDEQVTQHCKVLDTDTIDIVIGTDFLRCNPKVKMLSLQRPYALHCDFGSGLFCVCLELSGQKESGLRYVNHPYRTENYQWVRTVSENGLAALQVDLNEVQVELLASKEQCMMQLYCSRYLNNAYRFDWGSMELCYASFQFSQLAKVLTKIALEGATVILCTDWGTTGEHAYCRHQGFDIWYGWWKPATSKMQPLQDMQVRDDPKKGLHDVRSFIGACNFYRRHIHNFTYSSAPLTDL